LKDDAEFNWGAKPQATFEETKGYLSMLPVRKAQRSGIPF
jgi:hypothetical protein